MKPTNRPDLAEIVQRHQEAKRRLAEREETAMEAARAPHRFVKPCHDCGQSTRNEYYMVHDDLWTAVAGMEIDGGYLCVGCLEERIGRQLGPDDFTDVPANNPNDDPEWEPKTIRLFTRLTQVPWCDRCGTDTEHCQCWHDPF